MQHWRCAAWPMTAECWVRHRMSGKNQNTPRKGPNCPILAQIVVLRAAEWPRSRSRRPWPPCRGERRGNFATLTVTGRFRRSSDEPTIFVVGAVKRRPMQNDEEQPLDSSGDPKATNVAQDTTRALSIGV